MRPKRRAKRKAKQRLKRRRTARTWHYDQQALHPHLREHRLRRNLQLIKRRSSRRNYRLLRIRMLESIKRNLRKWYLKKLININSMKL